MLKITFAGDLSFANIEQFTWGSGIARVFAESDVNIVNLEAPLTRSLHKRLLKSYYLKADPQMSELLTPFTAVSLANNHILDYGVDSLTDTIAELNKAKIGYFGAGTLMQEAYKPYIIEKNGIKLAVFGATHFFRANMFIQAGTADIFSRRLLKFIARYKSEGYFIIVVPHWGYEHMPYPSPRERKAARKIIRAGADVIIGSHAHEIQMMEIIKGKHVFYGLGNFVFSSRDFMSSDHKLKESLLISIEIDHEHHCNLEILPCLGTDESVDLADENDSGVIKEYLRDISQSTAVGKHAYNKLFYEGIMKAWEARAQRIRHSRRLPKQSNTSKIKSFLVRLEGLDLQSLKIAAYIRIRCIRKLIIYSD